MIATGHWSGYYKFDKEDIQEKIGFASTNFEIEITKTDKQNFTGNVQDDMSTGGTEGIGEITGKVSGEKIKFIKQMPFLTLILDHGRNITF